MSKFTPPDTAPAEVSAEDGDTIEGYWSIFHTVDKVADVMEKGAFASAIAYAREHGKRIAVCLDHKWGMGGDGVVGYVDPNEKLPNGKFALYEDEHGLWARAHMFVADSAAARFAYKVVKTLGGSNASFAFDQPKSERRGKDGANHITDLGPRGLLELTITLHGAHPDTELRAVAGKYLMGLTADERTELARDFKAHGIRFLARQVHELVDDLDDDDAPLSEYEQKMVAEIDRLLDHTMVDDYARELAEIERTAVAKGFIAPTSETNAAGSVQGTPVPADYFPTKCPDCGRFATTPMQFAPGGYTASVCVCGTVMFDHVPAGTKQTKVDSEVRWLLQMVYPSVWTTKGTKHYTPRTPARSADTVTCPACGEEFDPEGENDFDDDEKSRRPVFKFRSSAAVRPVPLTVQAKAMLEIAEIEKDLGANAPSVRTTVKHDLDAMFAFLDEVKE